MFPMHLSTLLITTVIKGCTNLGGQGGGQLIQISFSGVLFELFL